MAKISSKVPRVSARAAKPARKKPDAFHNRKADHLKFKDPALTDTLEQLEHDAQTMRRSLPKLDPKVVILGSARSKPVPGENGYEDYAWSEKLGEELEKAGFSIGTGGGGGMMEAPMRGHARAQALLEMKKGFGWQTHAPEREGANIKLPHEQSANPFIDKGRLASFDRFLFRMEFLFRNTRDFLPTPGGYGTVAEVFTYLAMKEHGQVSDPVIFGSHDDFFKKLNHAFAGLMDKGELPDLKNVYTDPKRLVRALTKAGTDGKTDNVRALTARMVDDLELGLSKLDGKPPAFAFLGGSGPRSKASAKVAGAIAQGLAKDGQQLRVGGSPVIDEAVKGAAKDVQQFSLQPQAGSTRVHDLLVLRELMTTNVKGMVVTCEGPEQIAMLFTAACDIQTGKMPPIPIVVLDPDGKFAEAKKVLAETMLTKGRQYIDPKDLDILHVTNDPQEALRYLNEHQP